MSMPVSRALVALALSSSLIFACSSEGDDTDAGVKDSGTSSGMDAGFPDAETPDAGPTACNPFDGSGCTGDNVCVWVVNTDQAQCRTVGMTPKQHEQECSTTLLDCAAGYTCVALQGDANPICRKVCDTNGGANGCGGVTGNAMSYSCTGLQGKTNGVCVGSGASGNDCVPFDDMCPAAETCTYSGQDTTCQPSGTAARGASCMQSNCVKGSICLDVGGGPTCFEPCDPMAQNACATAGDLCLGLQGVSFGICQTPAAGCDPLNDMCPAGQVCTFDAPDLTCEAEGTVAIGGNCANENCARGGICILLQGEPNAKCWEPCDPQMPMCSAGQCGNIGLSFGLCVVR
ncbi:hypothetical protein L6R52_23330 [Myxococcota bacterium]|nr:hypothetical protein [Myxococcota bacterium]